MQAFPRICENEKGPLTSSLVGCLVAALSTVIGIKYTSRGDDKPFAVESYVPAEYDELVAFAAI